MVIATTEGQGRCYEVIVQSDGFLVQARELETGEIAPGETTLFRTLPAAFAYIDMAAAAERFVSARRDDEEWRELADEYHHEVDRFVSIREKWSDEGIGVALLHSRGRTLLETGNRLH
ncbi:hypothetical protein [Labrys monachus]|uniref:Uncharacterized protein n=1 Tax=Labrys monachus TaxID=217067 RepID=A0ABU0FIY3_9HYPH|nr:hypothetical protein [Labrys monachus]MDQ0394064.1 hypothetical protein [Labrys monachus]